MSKEEYGSICLMGHSSVSGKLRHVKKFGMDFIEVFSPVYKMVSEHKQPNSDYTEVYERLTHYKSAGLYTYHSIFQINISDDRPDKDMIREYYDELPFW